MSDVVSLEVIRTRRQAAIEAKREVLADAKLEEAFERVLAAFVCAFEQEMKIDLAAR